MKLKSLYSQKQLKSEKKQKKRENISSTTSRISKMNCDSHSLPLHTFSALIKQESSDAYNAFNAYVTKNKISSKDIYSSPIARQNGLHYDRFKICQFCYSIVDIYDIDREVVSLAMNYLDRVQYKRIRDILKHGCSDRSNCLENKKNNQMATIMACLHIAIEMSPSLTGWHWDYNPWYMALIYHSSVIIDPSDICKQESRILFELEFRVNPPTTLSFLQAMIPEEVFEHQNELKFENNTFLEELYYLIELCTLDESMFGFRASSIAYSALVTIVEKIKCCPNYMYHNLCLYQSDFEKLSEVVYNFESQVHVEEVRLIYPMIKDVIDFRFPDIGNINTQDTYVQNTKFPDSPNSITHCVRSANDNTEGKKKQERKSFENDSNNKENENVHVTMKNPYDHAIYASTAKRAKTVYSSSNYVNLIAM